MTHKPQHIDWNGLKVTYKITTGIWEGDTSVSGGVNHLPDEIEIISIETSSGADIVDCFTDETIEDIVDYIFDKE